MVMPARRVVNRELIKQHLHTANRWAEYLQSLQMGSWWPDGRRCPVQSPAYLPPPGAHRRRANHRHQGFPIDYGPVAELKSRGITVTRLALAPTTMRMMAGIARRSGGSHYFISRPELIPEVFSKESKR